MSMHGNVHIPSRGFTVEGDLHCKRTASGIVIFVHGSGVTRRERATEFVARRLEEAGFGTLLVDLLEDHETHDRHNVYDVAMQAERLLDVFAWLEREQATRCAQIGLFGSGVGSGVVLAAAARGPAAVAAIVCRAGRPDTALHYLPRVTAPTLFIDDSAEPAPDWVAMAHRGCCAPKELVVIGSAGHAYREPASLEALAQHTERWFLRYLPRAARLDARQNAPSAHR